MGRTSRLSVISCCLAEIPSFWMSGLRSRLQRLSTYVMLAFLCLLAFSPCPCSTLPWPRCVRLFSGPCIHRRFLESLRWGRSRQGPRPPPLLTVAAPHLWCLSRRRRQPPLLLPSRVERGGDARVWCPFRRPPAAPAAPVACERGLEKSPPYWFPPLLLVGECLSAHWRHWKAIGADSWLLSILRDGYRIPFKDSPPPLARTMILFPTYWAGSRSLALRQEVVKMLSKDALEGNCHRSRSRLLQ